MTTMDPPEDLAGHNRPAISFRSDQGQRVSIWRIRQRDSIQYAIGIDKVIQNAIGEQVLSKYLGETDLPGLRKLFDRADAWIEIDRRTQLTSKAR